MQDLKIRASRKKSWRTPNPLYIVGARMIGHLCLNIVKSARTRTNTIETETYYYQTYQIIKISPISYTFI